MKFHPEPIQLAASGKKSTIQVDRLPLMWKHRHLSSVSRRILLLVLLSVDFDRRCAARRFVRAPHPLRQPWPKPRALQPRTLSQPGSLSQPGHVQPDGPSGTELMGHQVLNLFTNLTSDDTIRQIIISYYTTINRSRLRPTCKKTFKGGCCRHIL